MRKFDSRVTESFKIWYYIINAGGKVRYIRLLMQKADTPEQIKRLVPEIRGWRGAIHLCEKASVLGGQAPMEIANRIREARLPEISRKRKEKINESVTVFMQRHI